jgi:hypothetical protein
LTNEPSAGHPHHDAVWGVKQSHPRKISKLAIRVLKRKVKRDCRASFELTIKLFDYPQRRVHHLIFKRDAFRIVLRTDVSAASWFAKTLR